MLLSRLFLSAVSVIASLVVVSHAAAQQAPTWANAADLTANPAAGYLSHIVPPRVMATLDIKAGTLQSIALPHREHLQPHLQTGHVGNQASRAGDRSATPNEELSQFSFRVTLAGAEQFVDVQASDVRAESYQILERTASGLAPVRPGACTTFRGGIVGDGASRVAVSFVDGELRAVIIRADGLWIVQPLRDAVPASSSNVYVVFHGSDALPGNGHCAVASLGTGSGTPPVFPDSVYECELALEADHALFQLNNSNTFATQSEVLGIVNAADVIYQGGLTVSFQVTQLIVDVVPDPYTSANAYALLSQLRSQWNTNHAGVTRDVTHLFSGRQIGAASAGSVGVAYTATACDVSNAYGLSQTRWSPNYALRVALTAHEIGHNFGADHCDLTGSCNIMCSGIGGCSGVAASFGPTALAEMNAYLQTVNCLALVPSMPQITSASPVLLATVSPPEVTLGGSGFLGTTTMTIGGQSFAGFQVLSDTQLRFAPPVGLALGVQSATVTNPAGTSNATFLLYQGSDPCQIVAPINTQGGLPFTWRIGGWANGTGYLGVSLVDTTLPLQGFPVMTGFLTLWMGPLDARGMASVTVPMVPAVLAGFPFYSQMIDSLSGTGTVRSTSLVLRTLIY
ncbi:MAG: hypothetical protein ACI89X_000813 [Planctomycetota bacterium]|jgi:hypothetical protein